MTATAPTSSQTLADYAESLRVEDLPPSTRQAATVLILDTLGTIAASADRPEVKELRLHLPANREATVIGAPSVKTDAEWAAFTNAVAGSFLELDQGERPTGHPALHILPSALAHAERSHASGSQLLAAFVAGYEIQSRLEHAFTLRWPVHPHGTFGTPAAAAALAKLDAAPAEEIRQSINAGSSLTAATSWTSCLEGATTRNAFAGLTARSAFLARVLVKSGFTAIDDAPLDTFGRVLGEPLAPEALTVALGSTHAIDDAYIKFHAACALVHPALDAILDALGVEHRPAAYPPAVARRRLEADEIDHVTVLTTERASLLQNKSVDNELAAKFSIPFAVATLMINGTTEPEAFSGENLNSVDVQQVAARVEVKQDAKLTALWPSKFCADVAIHLRDGTTLAGHCMNPYGSRDNPPSHDHVRAKFEHLIGLQVGQERAAASWDIGARLLDYSDITAWLDDLLGPYRASAYAQADRQAD